MKLKSSAKFALTLFLILMTGFAALGLVFSKGIIFRIQHVAMLCSKCAMIEHRTFTRILFVETRSAKNEQTVVHSRAFAEQLHPTFSLEHKAVLVLESVDKELKIQRPYFTNAVFQYDWEAAGGFPLHADTKFAAAFTRLRTSDRTWADHQWLSLNKKFILQKFPASLVPFKTNNNEQVFFEVLQNTDLDTGDPRDAIQFPLPKDRNPSEGASLSTTL